MSHGRAEPDSRAVARSARLFQRLLAAYPPAHRREYGPAMVQLFRDQCRDAWRDGRGWGLTALWLRVVPDLIKTAVREHLSSLKERNTMLERLGMLLRERSAPRSAFIAAFAAVFLLTVAMSTLITFLIPETYLSTARMLLRPAPGEASPQAGPRTPLGPPDPYLLKTQLEFMQSPATLGRVIDELNLARTWGKEFGLGSPLAPSETLALLRARIDLRPVRNTRLIEIRVFSRKPAEAAEIANAIAESCRDSRSQIASADIADMAVPGLKPVRPNKPLNLALGVMGGGFLAVAAGAGSAGLAAWIGRNHRGPGAPPPPGAVPPPDLPQVGGRPAKSALDKVTGILWMGIGGTLFGLTLVALVWFLIFQQASVTAELLLLPVFGLCWGSNAVLGFFLSRGKRWARICLGAEGVLFLTYYYFRYGFPLPHCPAWVSIMIIRLGSFIFGAVPYVSRWVFIALALASICALLWPRKEIAANPC